MTNKLHMQNKLHKEDIFYADEFNYLGQLLSFRQNTNVEMQGG